ncbi:TIGR04222 domain-containing membrane protein [Streptomyces catenulae]|uniref:TIGR04222 domain-containing membrane protein n=1 Tax=Streptomyces catenulae TaxID=66875 RepID=A0ABV2Z4T5_9ACTN|nr:TIGR04222 domain-containing membrane protein [Streptomyces catenulae]
MGLLFLAVAVLATAVACLRVCRTARALPPQPPHPSAVPEPGPPYGPTLYETAFLAGGPDRVADVTLVSMAQQRRLLLAHTGWATVVDPVGRDAVECAVLAAIGADGQRRIPAIRDGLAATEALRSLTERLTAAGLAPRTDPYRGLREALRQVRAATLVVLLAAAAAVWQAPPERAVGPLLGWFALPLVLTAGTWATARAEYRPAARWATEAGAGRLRRAAGTGRPASGDALTALALHGPRALDDPSLRSALHSSGV